MGPLLIERALKTDLSTTVAAYQNILIPMNNGQNKMVHVNFDDDFGAVTKSVLKTN